MTDAVRAPAPRHAESGKPSNRAGALAAVYRRGKTIWHYQMVRLDREDLPLLQAEAKRKHTSVAELIRTFITWGLENSE